MGRRARGQHQFIFPLDPTPAGRLRHGKYGNYYPKVYERFRRQAERVIPEVVGGFAPLTGPLDVTVEFYRRRPKTTRREWPVGDIDNYEKAIYDACNELLWEDDDQIVDNANRKRFAPPGEDGYIRLVVRPADL